MRMGRSYQLMTLAATEVWGGLLKVGRARESVSVCEQGVSASVSMGMCV